MKRFNGVLCRIMWNDKKMNSEKGSADNLNLYIKNIPSKVNPREVYEKFSEFGDIFSIKINENSDGSTQSYCYICYDNA